jgi:hypothetical protein
VTLSFFGIRRYLAKRVLKFGKFDESSKVSNKFAVKEEINE